MLLFRFWYKGDHSRDPEYTLFVRFRRGNAPFFIQRVISLMPESKQQQTTSTDL